MDIKEKAKELCTCHHKCKDTTDCVVEDEAIVQSNKKGQPKESSIILRG